ncbi:MAG: ABC transporter substrate-binding protein [Clostridiaceae bacterium]|nr:ABC transporter substrate-binding protein [Clostridiaceae bacterium]
MKNNRFMKALSIVLMLALSISLITACNPQTTSTTGQTSQETTKAPTTTETAPKSTAPLVVGYSTFSEKFSPFFADTAYDQDVVDMTAVPLLTTDRTGAIVYNAIDGEKIKYNGTEYTYKGIANLKVDYDKTADKTVYTWTIRDDIKFSDGEKLTADDIIFSYYVYADATYNGSVTLYSVPIVGLKDYRTQTTSAVYDKYSARFDKIMEKGEKYKLASGDEWTQEQQDSAWTLVKEAWIADVQAIVDYVNANYASSAQEKTGFTAEEIAAEDGLKIMFGMVMWGYGTVENKVLTAPSGKTWDLSKKAYPTIEDYYNETYAAYEGDAAAYWKVEAADDDSVLDAAKNAFILKWGPLDAEMGSKGIPNIEGIKKNSDTEVQITVDGFDATAVYNLGITVSPLHYYGDKTKYDYANNKFGFERGDLSSIKAKTTTPMGAGPYKFIKFENKVVYFEANEYFYKGEPITKNLQFKETNDDDKISGVGTGTIDLTDPSFSTAAVEEISSYNSDGKTTGDKLVTTTVDNLGYGYVGINAATVNVGGVPDSDASKQLRKGIATILAVYRDLAIDSYYGERAAVINYPISSTSWAAPQKTDDGYKVAFSTAVDGKDIYTSDMNADAKYKAALTAAIDYFVAAGYTYDKASGKLTAAPAGAKLEYEAIIPGEGKGDHPSFMLLTKAKEAMATIGINLIINDPADDNELWDKIDAGTQELWCAAWGATIDPDMYQIYYSGNIVGKPGSSESNHYHIADAQLDQLIMDARSSADQAYRKATYKACLDIIIDWAVEIPIYQRQNCFLFSKTRINMDTVTPDITTFWDWQNDIEKLAMN